MYFSVITITIQKRQQIWLYPLSFLYINGLKACLLTSLAEDAQIFIRQFEVQGLHR